MFSIKMEHKSSCDFFFLIYCKNITNFLFWVLWTCLATSIKNDNANLQKLQCLSACKNWTPFLTSFFQILLTCYFQYFENAWLCPSIMMVLLYRELWCPKCWNQLVAIICMQKINLISNFFLRYCKDIAILLFWELWTSSFTPSLRYCKDIVNLLFWVLCACLATHTQSDTINLWKTFVFISRQKINVIIHAFLEILQICKLILGTLGMPGYKPPNCWYRLVEDFDVYLHAKNKLHHSLLSWDITF